MREINEILMVAVWPVTSFLAGLSLSVFLLLVAVRFFRDRKQACDTTRRQEIRTQLLIHLATPLKDLKQTLVRQESDRELVAAEAPALLRTLKGASYARLLDALESVGLYVWALEKLHGKSKAKKMVAIPLIAHWPSEEVKRQLEAQLSDPHPLVRYAAMEALARSKDARFLRVVIREFARRPLSPLLMADSVQKFGNDTAKKLARYVRLRNLPTSVRISLMMALIHTGNTASIRQAALAFHTHRESELRALAYHALSVCGERIDKTLLEAAMKDEDWRVRQYVARCAAYCEPLPADILSTLLKDESWLVALRAGQILHRSGAPGIALLQSIARSESLAGARARMLLAEQRAKGGGAHGMV